jgi:hypothetical protein
MRAFVALAIVCAASHAYADDEIVRGTVVKIEAQEIYVNIGVSRGVESSAQLRLKRPVSLKHPVTRATVQDWIPIGSATVTQAGAVMSRAVVGDLVASVKVGDIVEVLVDRPDAPTPQTPPTPPAKPDEPPPTPIDPQTAEVLGVFSSQSGLSLDARIATWERYLSIRGNSPYAAAIRRDLDQLHALKEELRPRPANQASEVTIGVAHNAAKKANAGEQVPLVFVLAEPERVASAYLHYRARGGRTYRSVLLVREHDIYLRGALPAEYVKTPGIDYFLEVSTPDGRTGLPIGTPREPIAVDVAEPTILDRFASTPGRSFVKIAADYSSFSSLDTRANAPVDRMFTANVDFVYRLDSHVESLGVGYGVYAGRGGTAMPLPTGIDVDEAAFHYGYADIEVGGRTEGVHVSGGAQVIAGVGQDGFGMGFEGRVRIGDRDATNLAIIGRTVDQVGFLSDIRFGARPAKSVLVGVSVGATDQPTNSGEVAVKLGTELEIIAIQNVSIILRGSWQGRSTAHGGLGGGGGLGFYW